ncbi:hypothetical protein MKW92_027117 [Papaver armeniacum]|nr:hypothetical protein MKW92_027117 [Papaver armeniacum]
MDLQKCSNLKHLKEMQAQIMKANLHQDPFVAPKLISAFSICHQMPLAVKIFNQIQEPNVHLYNTLMRAFAHNSQYSAAFSTFFDLQENVLFPDNYTYPILLKACCSGGPNHLLLRQVQMIHTHIEKFGFYSDIFVPNSLIDTYSKCGKIGIVSAKKEMTERNVVTWNTLLQGLAMHGNCEKALSFFSRMTREGIEPGVTFVSVLSSCSHAGLVDEGRHYFSLLKRDYGSALQVEHYGCMLIKTMPMEPNAIIWGTLLGACRMHSNVELAEEVVDRLVQLEPKDAGSLAIFSNIYAAAGDWDRRGQGEIENERCL